MLGPRAIKFCAHHTLPRPGILFVPHVAEAGRRIVPEAFFLFRYWHVGPPPRPISILLTTCVERQMHMFALFCRVPVFRWSPDKLRATVATTKTLRGGANVASICATGRGWINERQSVGTGGVQVARSFVVLDSSTTERAPRTCLLFVTRSGLVSCPTPEHVMGWAACCAWAAFPCFFLSCGAHGL